MEDLKSRFCCNFTFKIYPPHQFLNQIYEEVKGINLFEEEEEYLSEEDSYAMPQRC